jgi:hypothetical protein
MTAEQMRPDIAIVRLNEGFVMDHLGYTTAHTNADDLAERVRQVAAQGDAGLAVPEPTPTPTQQAVTPELREATAVPAAVAPATNLSEAVQWDNARKLIAFMAAGFDANGKMFTRADFDKALPMFAPTIDHKAVEFELGEFLAGLHDDE